MRKSIALSIALLSLVPLAALAQTKPMDPGEGDVALLFSFQGITTPIKPFEDGFQSGAGLKYWFSQKLSGRALVFLSVEPDAATDTTVTSSGLSLGGEYHVRGGRVSPYLGAMLAGKFLKDESGNYLDFAVGAMAGLEVALLKDFSLCCEYPALLVRDRDGVSFAFGETTLFSLLIYF